MFRFEHPEHLWALVLIPILFGLFFYGRYLRKKAANNFGNNALLRQLAPQVGQYKHSVKFAFWILAFMFLVVGWANPQWGTKREKAKRKSVDIFIAMDISNSMLAEDINPNRMERTKKFTQRLIENLKGNRLGTIIFAGNAYLQMPLTTDYSAANLFIKSTDPSMAPTQGTAISEAIRLALQSFERNDENNKAIIIITDGENHEEAALEMTKEAVKRGTLVATIGVGTTEGSPIPMSINGALDYKKDKDGSIVKTKLNEIILQEIAEIGGGGYYNLSTNNSKIIGNISKRIEQLETKEFEQRVFTEYESYFQYFISFGLLLIIIEFMLSYTKNLKWSSIDLFKTKKTMES